LVAIGKKRRARLALLLVLLGIVLFSVNCGSGGSSKTAIAPGTYQITVTGTGGNAVSHSATITLNVS